jgi:hypothetical protein
MYSEKFVATIKAGGKVLREHGNIVYVPFGSEFSIFLKNLNTVRASVSISIDGEDVLNGSSIIVDANKDIELERYLKDLDKGNRFKFIERTSSIEQYRGVGTEDGLVRIEYQFEKPQIHWYGCIDARPMYVTSAICRGTVVGSVHDSESYSAQSVNDAMSYVPQNDVGITVPGSLSTQQFTTVAPLNLETEKHVIVLQIKGETEQNKPVVVPVTVKVKPKCQTCGKVNKSGSKFCSNCGTSLDVI